LVQGAEPVQALSGRSGICKRPAWLSVIKMNVDARSALALRSGFPSSAGRSVAPTVFRPFGSGPHPLDLGVVVAGHRPRRRSRRLSRLFWRSTRVARPAIFLVQWNCRSVWRSLQTALMRPVAEVALLIPRFVPLRVPHETPPSRRRAGRAARRQPAQCRASSAPAQSAA
jgi:hypothetical protein